MMEHKNKPSERRKLQKEENKQAGKKDTKKWCRGVVNREHQTELKSWLELRHLKPSGFGSISNWKVEVCKVCKKQLNHHY